MKDCSQLSIQVKSNTLRILDQRRLPHEEVWIEVDSPLTLIPLIQSLAVRGAPLIGVSAAVSIGLLSINTPDSAEIIHWAGELRKARPTAVNLMNAMDRILAAAKVGHARIAPMAEEILWEDISLCERMAHYGASLIETGEGILTHCNTGALATAGIGTALGVIRRAHEQGKEIHVFVDETRPLLQGARLTAWELEKLKIPYTLICDNMAASLMAKGKVHKIFVGADRIAANGDVANKIGTYGVAVSAHHHGIPFYVVAPSTTLDPNCPSGKEIPIEERAANEVRGVNSPHQAKVWNPAFDITPRGLIKNIILETGLV